MAEIELERDPVLRDRFEDVRSHVADASGDTLLGVFHIGSTAIPDLAAKPMVDVLAVYSGYEAARATAERLAAAEYRVRKDERDWIQLVHTDGEDDAFVHFRPIDSDGWRDQLVFREYLRENPDARREYERVKRTAATEHPDSAEAYTAAKDDVVRRLEARAYEEGYGDRIPDLRP